MTPWTVAHQAPLFMGILQAEYWSGLSCPPPGDLPNPGIEPRSPALQADSLLSKTPGNPKNTGAGSLSFLQGTFPTWELDQGLLHCRQTLPAELSGKPHIHTTWDLMRWALQNMRKGSLSNNGAQVTRQAWGQGLIFDPLLYVMHTQKKFCRNHRTQCRWQKDQVL